MKNGQRLGWGHITIAVEYKNGNLLHELLELVLEKGLTVGGLRQEIRRRERSNRSNVGKNITVPHGLKSTLINFTVRSERLAECLDLIFYEKVIAPLTLISPEIFSSDLQKLIATGRASLEVLSDLACDHARELAWVEFDLQNISVEAAPTEPSPS